MATTRKVTRIFFSSWVFFPLNTKIQIQIRPGIHQTGYRTIKALLHVLSKTTRSHYKYPMFRNLSCE
jgi:hypothetical protein